MQIEEQIADRDPERVLEIEQAGENRGQVLQVPQVGVRERQLGGGTFVGGDLLLQHAEPRFERRELEQELEGASGGWCASEAAGGTALTAQATADAAQR